MAPWGLPGASDPAAKPGEAASPFPGTIQGHVLTKRQRRVSPSYSLPKRKQPLQVARGTGRYSEGVTTAVEIPTKFSLGFTFQFEVGFVGWWEHGSCTRPLHNTARGQQLISSASTACPAASGPNFPRNPSSPQLSTRRCPFLSPKPAC